MTLWSHELQHARLLCPSLSPGVCSNSCALSQWCYLTISSSITIFPFSFSVFPSTGVFSNELALPIKWPKYWSFSIIPSNEWSGLIFIRIDWFDLLLSKGLSRFFFSITAWKHQFFSAQPLQSNSHLYMTTVKTMALLFIWTFVAKVMSLLFNTQPSLS